LKLHKEVKGIYDITL